MAKIIIDNHLIDLEMITHIDAPSVEADTDFEGDYTTTWFSWVFKIHMVGKKTIEISRGIWRDNKHDEGNKYKEPIGKMYNELIKRWSPNTTKFDDITVK